MAVEAHNGYFLYRYNPSLVAAAVVSGIYLILTLAIVYRMVRARSWFVTAFVVGGIFEVTGYLARCFSHNNTAKLGPFIIQSILLLVAPALFAASIYMTLGRTIRSVHAEHHSVIRVNWLTKLFVIGDVLAFLVQSFGAGIQAKGGKIDLGRKIILVGLFIQIIMFGLFIVTAFIFHGRMNKKPTRESHATEIDSWRKMLWMLYAVSALIMVRSIFRVVEYIMGQKAYPLTHEWTLYVFDGVLMAACMVFFLVWFPGRLQAAANDVEGRGVSYNHYHSQGVGSVGLGRHSEEMTSMGRGGTKA